MQLKSFLKIIILSFYSPNLYIEIANKWQHWGLGFLVRFSILISLITSLCLFTFISMIDFNNEAFRSLLNQIPEMQVIQDKAVFINKDLKSPIYVGTNQNMLVIDLDAKTSEKYPDNLLAFTSYGITANLLDSSPFTISYNNFLSDKDSKIINPNSLLEFMIQNQKKILIMILVLGAPLGSLIYFVMTLFKSLFYSSLASIATGIFNLNLTLKQLTRIAIIANAPAFIISSIFLMLFFESNLAALSQLIATTLYLLYFLGGVIICLKYRK